MCFSPFHRHKLSDGLVRKDHKHRFVFRRFAQVFGAVILLYLASIGILLGLIYRPLRDVLPGPVPFVLIVCGLPVGFTLLASLVSGLMLRRFGTPMAEVMAAADAVAEGDLTVRVREEVPGEMGRLARSFNRMTTELARADQQRRNLTADVAHELRTPLHIIQGNLEGILDGVYEPTHDHITATLEETRLLARLVNDLQTLSLAEAGQLPLHCGDLPADGLLEDVAASFSGQASKAGITLRVEVAPEVSGQLVHVDPDRIDQVLSNLVSNALRYTPPGGEILLRAQPLPPGKDTRPGVRLQVQDSGTGISPEDLPYIFDRFWRGDRSRSRSSGGSSGLGLAIARQLVKAHGGSISVQSEPGRWTTFSIDLSGPEKDRLD